MATELQRNQDTTCYIGNLDDRVTDSLMWELMIQMGPLVNVYLPKDRITQMHQGYAFAEYQTETDADYACNILNGIKMFGKPIRVHKAGGETRDVDIGANVFVGNLDPAVDERQLYETFGAFGGVLGMPKSGESKSHGFVSFDSFEASDAAIEALNGQYLHNRQISVKYALKKNNKHGERHGTEAERLLAAQARRNQVLPQLHEMAGSYEVANSRWGRSSSGVQASTFGNVAGDTNGDAKKRSNA